MLVPHELVDHFRVVRRVGRGGMGEVYLARDMRLGRKVALKVINPERLGSAHAVERFLHEARTTARFSHPHIVTVYGAGAHRGCPYLALEFLEGQSLKQRMKEEWPSARETLRMGLAIAEALKEAHSHGVLHRDLKPENVFIPRDGRLRVVDFGLAMELGEASIMFSGESPPARPKETLDYSTTLNLDDPAAAELSGDLTESAGEHLTLADVRRSVDTVGARVVGTPAYMAPEQWEGRESTGATDVWALGVVLFMLLAGRRPYAERTAMVLAAQVTGPDPAPLLSEYASVSTDLVDLVRACLEKRPEARPSAADVEEKLGQLLHRGERLKSAEESPFRGLLPFSEKHASLFYGRDTEVEGFLEQLREEPLLAVVGRSGAGKSSFVRAGVIPRLRERGPWTVLSMRPGDRPFATLAARLQSGETLSRSRAPGEDATIEMRGPNITGVEAASDVTALTADAQTSSSFADDLRSTPQLLSLVLQRLAEEEQVRVLLFVDQLEELYTLVEDAEVRRGFLRALLSAADDPDGPVRVVFTLRDDFISQIDTGRDGGTALRQVTVLRTPSPESLREILVRPMEAVGYRFDTPELVDEMIDAVKGEPASLPLLQFTAQVLWERRDRETHELRRAAYEAVGGVAGALADHADGVLEAMTGEQVELARRMLLRLVTPQGTRRVLARDRVLTGLDAGADEVLARLVRARLLGVDKGARGGGEAGLELVHEALIRSWGQLARWLDESREELAFLGEVGQAAELWDRRGRRDEEVWLDDALREARRMRARCQSGVPQLVDDFLAASARRQHTLRRRRRLIIAAGVLALAGVALASLIAAVTLADKERLAREHGAQIRLQWAEAQREGARAALARGDLLEARAKVRGSLEAQDSALARTLWWRLRHEPLRWRQELTTAIAKVAFSSDGAWVAVAAQDRVVRLLDVETRSERVLRGHRDHVLAIAFSTRSPLLATGDASGEIRLWDLETGQARALHAHQAPVWDLAFSPDGATLASASWDKTVALWEVKTGRARRSLEGHSEAVRAVAFAPDGASLASGASDGNIRIWPARGTARVRVLSGHTAGVASIAFSPDGRRLVSGGDDAAVKLWRLEDGVLVEELRGHGDRVRSVGFSPDGALIASAGADQTVRLWRARDGGELRRLAGHTNAVNSLSFSPDGRRLATGGEDTVLRVWDINAPAALDAQEQGHQDGAAAVIFSPDGITLASSSYDKTVRLWEVATGDQRAVLRGHEGDVYGLAFSPDGATLASASTDKSVRLWDVASGATRAVLSGHAAMVADVAFSADGHALVSGSYDKSVRVWSLPDGVQRERLVHDAWVTAVAVSPDARQVAAAGYDSVIQLWDLASGRQSKQLIGHRAEPRSIAFSPDGRWLISGGSDQQLLRWNLASGESTVVGEHQGRIYHVAFGPDGARVASASADGSARLWPLDGGPVVTLGGDMAEVNGCAFSPDGRLVATAADDATVRLWDSGSGLPRWRCPLLMHTPGLRFSHRGWSALGDQAAPVTAHSAWQRAVEARALDSAQSTDGALLCLQTVDAQVELWELATDRQLAQQPVAGLRRVIATDEGCAALAEGHVFLLTRTGVGTRLPLAASAIAWHRGELLAAVEREILVFDGAAAPRPLFEADPGVTALRRTSRHVVLGYGEGSIELIPLDDERARPTFSFEATPASAVTCLREGPMGTLMIGFENGTVGLWSVDNGAALFKARLHGPINHLLLSAGWLHATSALGAARSLDLGVLSEDHGDLLRAIRREVPIRWESGLPVRSPVPVSGG